MAFQDSEFDVIVIGAGHNGLACAAYLARAGLKVGVIEGEDHIGGGTATSEILAPGFRSNTCANFLHGFDVSPIYPDLELNRYGFDYIVPDVPQAYVYGDGRALVLHQALEPTLDAVGRFSQKDATSWKELVGRYLSARPLLVASQYSLPGEGPSLAAAALSQGLVSNALSEELAALAQLSPYDAIDQAFEDEHIRVLFKKLIHVIQATNVTGVGAMFPGLLMNLTRTCLAVGGTQSLPDALAAVLEEHGGEILTGDPVDEIIVRNRTAEGVRLRSGLEIDALEAVVTGIDFPQAVRLVGEDHFSASVRDKAENWDWTTGGSLATIHLALREAPHYRAESYDPDVARAFNISFGADNTEEITQSMAAVEAGAFPELPVGNGSCNSVLDPSYVDGDGHVAFWWPFAPYSVDGSPSHWEERREEYTTRLLDVWRRYADNLDDSNTLEVYLRTPVEVEKGNATMTQGAVRTGPYTAEQSGANRPHPDLADYRFPGLTGLYHCGSTSPSGGGVNGAAGYCAAGVIADDLAVDRWWPRMTLERAQELAGM